MMIPFAHSFFLIQTPYYLSAHSPATTLRVEISFDTEYFSQKIPKQTYFLEGILLKFFQTGISINLGLMVR